MQLLKQYKAWQSSEMLRLGEYYQRRGFVFSQDNGAPMHPDSVTTWLDRFSRHHNLPHITPHALRHTMTSLLIFNGVETFRAFAGIDNKRYIRSCNRAGR